jgi:drug/metabolite transporter (DMT)-like permease
VRGRGGEENDRLDPKETRQCEIIAEVGRGGFAAVYETVVRPQLVLAVLYIGIAPTVIGFLSWNARVRRLGSSGTMVFYNALPLRGALLGYLFLGESIGLAHLLGGALIVGGGLWAARGRRRTTQ